MLARFTAAFLVVLITAPFTAPFSTCDLASMHYGTANAVPQHSATVRLARANDVSHSRLLVPVRVSRKQKRDEEGDPASPVTVSGESAVPVMALEVGARNRLSLLVQAFAPSGVAIIARPPRRTSPFERRSVQDPPSVPGVLRL